MSEILKRLPVHNMYVELLSGNETNLMRKIPTQSEVYNDNRNLIIDFFKVLRDLELKDVYVKYVFENDFSVIENNDKAKTISKERWEELKDFYFYFNNNKIEGNFKRCTGFRDATKEMENYLNDISTDMLYMVKRLRMLQYEARPFDDIISRFDGKDSLFYIDVTNAHNEGIDEKQLVYNLLNVSGKCIINGVKNSSDYSILIDEGWREIYDEELNKKFWINYKI